MSWFLSGYASGCQTYSYNGKSLNHKILFGRDLWTSSPTPTTQRKANFKVYSGPFQSNFEYLQGKEIPRLLWEPLPVLKYRHCTEFVHDLQLEFPKRQSCFLSFCCASLRSFWLHLLCNTPLVSWRQKSDLLFTFPSPSKSILLCFPLYIMCSSPGPFLWFCLQFDDICCALGTPKLETVLHRGG